MLIQPARGYIPTAHASERGSSSRTPRRRAGIGNQIQKRRGGARDFFILPRGGGVLDGCQNAGAMSAASAKKGEIEVFFNKRTFGDAVRMGNRIQRRRASRLLSGRAGEAGFSIAVIPSKTSRGMSTASAKNEEKSFCFHKRTFGDAMRMGNRDVGGTFFWPRGGGGGFSRWLSKRPRAMSAASAKNEENVFFFTTTFPGLQIEIKTQTLSKPPNLCVLNFSVCSTNMPPSRVNDEYARSRPAIRYTPCTARANSFQQAHSPLDA